MPYITLFIATMLCASTVEADLERLSSTDQGVRQEAAQRLKGQELPAEAGDIIRRYIALEVQAAETPLPKDFQSPAVPYEAIPRDTSPTRIKTSPQAHVGEIFTVVGLLQVGDYYNYGYRDAGSTHHSLILRHVAPDGTSGGETLYPYAPRMFTPFLIEKVTKAQEARQPLFVRLKVTLDRDRWRGPDSWEMLEVVDWQISERGKWSPWVLENIARGIVLLGQTGDQDALVDLITAPKIASPTSHALVSYAAALEIGKLDKKYRARAVARIKKAATAARREKETERAERLTALAVLINALGK